MDTKHKVGYVSGKYYAVYYPSHPDSDKNGYIYEHRLVAEKILGRRLKPEEVVHHEDKNSLNNSKDNLKVFATTKDHNRYHKGFEIYCKNNVWYAIPKYRCNCCGKEITPQSKTGMCKNCLINQRKSVQPSRDELLKLLDTTSYSEIGRQYNVTANAVKKWAKIYGIYKYCFYKEPNLSDLEKYMQYHTVTEASKYYNTPNDTIRNWCKKHNIHIKQQKIKCIETEEIFDCGKDVIRKYLPNLSAKSKAESLRLAIKTGEPFLGYHWVEILI